MKLHCYYSVFSSYFLINLYHVYGEEAKAHNYRNFDPTGYYKAAVVEYAADEGNEGLNSEQILWKNAENFEKLIADAAGKNTDIIVFPEYGLTSASYALFQKESSGVQPFFQRIPEVGVNPCTRDEFLILVDSEVIHHLSCAARLNRIYVVINLGELVPSNGTTRDARYNSAIVFDREGTIVAKYRKYNLFAEPQFDAPATPELATFVTDFGVEFGIFICFDMLFEQPAKQLVKNGVKHFVFSTAWIDELPFLTAIQAQMFWSSSSNATLLASGYHYPQFGKMGSGIYLPTGQPLNYTFNPNSGTQVIYATVPKSAIYHPNLKSVSELPSSRALNVDQLFAQHWYYRENLANYTGVNLASTGAGEKKVSACDSEFCCEVQYAYDLANLIEPSDADDGPRHKLIVFNQQRKFSSPSVVRLMGLQVCAIVRCLNNTMESCAEYGTNSNFDVGLPGFESVKLSGSPFKLYEHSLPGFTTLDSNLEVIPVQLFDQDLSIDKRSYSVRSTNLRRFQIQTIALFHRAFSSQEFSTIQI